MLKLTIQNGKVVVDPTLLMVKELTDIIEYGQSKKNEDLGNRMLLYVFYCCDLTDQNPLRDIDYRMKEDQANVRAFKKKKTFLGKEEKLIGAAMDAYNFMNETSLERAGLSYDKKIDEIRTLLDNITPEVHATVETHMCEACSDITGEPAADVTEIIGYVSNDKIIANFSKQLNEMATYKLKAMETAKKIENTGRVRGDKGSSLIERGSFRKDKKDG